MVDSHGHRQTERIIERLEETVPCVSRQAKDDLHFDICSDFGKLLNRRAKFFSAIRSLHSLEQIRIEGLKANAEIRGPALRQEGQMFVGDF